ncbi:MAG: hypothetical protein IJT83_06915 [Victivallales bacterium]|nr:hypothetical protein [Victivallales bacterium]
MKRCLFTLFFCLGLCLAAQNIVQNSDFSFAVGDGALLWKSDFAYKTDLRYLRLEKGAAFDFSSETPKTISIRQYSLTLVPGEKYRITCDVSAENLAYEKMWCVIANNGWKKDAGIKFDKGTLTTDGIRHFEKVCTAPETVENSYSICFYLNKATGHCRVFKVTLEPLTEKGRLGSRSNLKLEKPFMGILAVNRMAIPLEQNTLDIVASPVPGAPLFLQAEIDGKTLPELPFKDYKATLDISAYKTGNHHLVIKAVQDGKVLAQREEEFAFAEPLLEFHHTRKGFTEELLNVKTDGKRQFDFVLPTDGWCFIRVETTPGKIVLAHLDDTIGLYPKGSYRNETMRRLKRGLHRIVLHEDVQGTLQVRAVPLVLKYAGVSKQVSFPTMSPYDWEWHKKHVVGRSANFGPDGIKADCLEESKLFGVTFARRYHVNRAQEYSPEQAEKTLQEFNTCRALLDKDSYYVGMDEYAWQDYGALLNFADIAGRINNVHNKYIMHWIADPYGPRHPGVHHYVIEQLLNMGGAKGLLAFECYFRTSRTEAEARKMITDSFHSIVDGCESFFPGTAAKTLLCFSNMNHPTYITSAQHTNVNFKYFMDLEMYLLANSPAGSRIGGVGYWGCHYADEDINLWTQELYRHYCCDGNTEMLSKQYGYTYELPYLQNGDFNDGLNGFRAKGDVTVDTLPGFSRTSMAYFRGDNHADAVAVLAPGAFLETTAVKLDPNCSYKLEYVTADYEDVKNKIYNPKPIPMAAQFSDIEILAQFDFVDNIKKKRNDYPRIHYHVTHFRPKNTTMPLAFSCDGNQDRKCILTFVKIEPLFVKRDK